MLSSALVGIIGLPSPCLASNRDDAFSRTVQDVHTVRSRAVQYNSHGGQVINSTYHTILPIEGLIDSSGKTIPKRPPLKELPAWGVIKGAEEWIIDTTLKCEAAQYMRQIVKIENINLEEPFWRQRLDAHLIKDILMNLERLDQEKDMDTHMFIREAINYFSSLRTYLEKMRCLGDSDMQATERYYEQIFGNEKAYTFKQLEDQYLKNKKVEAKFLAQFADQPQQYYTYWLTAPQYSWEEYRRMLDEQEYNRMLDEQSKIDAWAARRQARKQKKERNGKKGKNPRERLTKQNRAQSRSNRRSAATPTPSNDRKRRSRTHTKNKEISKKGDRSEGPKEMKKEPKHDVDFSEEIDDFCAETFVTYSRMLTCDYEKFGDEKLKKTQSCPPMYYRVRLHSDKELWLYGFMDCIPKESKLTSEMFRCSEYTSKYYYTETDIAPCIGIKIHLASVEKCSVNRKNGKMVLDLKTNEEKYKMMFSGHSTFIMDLKKAIMNGQAQQLEIREQEELTHNDTVEEDVKEESIKTIDVPEVHDSVTTPEEKEQVRAVVRHISCPTDFNENHEFVDNLQAPPTEDQASPTTPTAVDSDPSNDMIEFSGTFTYSTECSGQSQDEACSVSSNFSNLQDISNSDVLEEGNAVVSTTPKTHKALHAAREPSPETTSDIPVTDETESTGEAKQKKKAIKHGKSLSIECSDSSESEESSSDGEEQKESSDNLSMSACSSYSDDPIQDEYLIGGEHEQELWGKGGRKGGRKGM